MKLKTTKALLKEINKSINNNYKQEYHDSNIDHISYITLTPKEYEYYVDYDELEHENDYNFNLGLFSAWEVVYKDNCYSNNKYITTNDLIYLYKHLENKTIKALTNELLKAYSI